jgi:ABC-type multidrug transport system ATPase subunit
MLARALALNPKVLILDDFTARVDANTERKILGNVEKNYPEPHAHLVTQKIAPIEHYDQIVLLMEGEVLARGTHEELMETSPEYVQIFDSQKSTSQYEKGAKNKMNYKLNVKDEEQKPSLWSALKRMAPLLRGEGVTLVVGRYSHPR